MCRYKVNAVETVADYDIGRSTLTYSGAEILAQK
jgi:hypothetical protein